MNNGRCLPEKSERCLEFKFTQKPKTFFFFFFSCSWLVILRSPLDKLAVLIRQKMNYCLRQRRWEFQLLQLSWIAKNKNAALWPANILAMNLNSTNLSWGSAVLRPTLPLWNHHFDLLLVFTCFTPFTFDDDETFFMWKNTQKTEKTIETWIGATCSATTHSILRFNLQNWTNTHHRSWENIS